jgi:hypothetical protein
MQSAALPVQKDKFLLTERLLFVCCVVRISLRVFLEEDLILSFEHETCGNLT